MDVFKPGGARLGETDLTVVIDGALWVGEAKSNASLGSNSEEGLRRLRRVAEHLRADGVLLVAEERPFPSEQVVLAERVFEDAGPEFRVVVV